jgi:hypothetical protein
MRPGITWVIVGAVVGIGLFAGLDALRSSDGEPPASAENASEGVTTPQTGTGVESSSVLSGLRPVRLIPGLIRMDRAIGIVAFTVPPGWYGSSADGLVLGKRINPGVIGAVDFRSEGSWLRDLTLGSLQRLGALSGSGGYGSSRFASGGTPATSSA